MSFLYPAVLWFLGLLCIPIFIHLFNLRRYEKIYFSNVNFLDTVKSSSRSKLTLKQWLALIRRLLALGFLIVTFAVPFFPGDLTEGSSNQKVIFLDNSYSTSNIAKDGLTAFDNGSESVLKYLDQYNLEDKFYFATNNSYSRASRSIDQVKDELSELNYSTESQSRSLQSLANIGGEGSSNSYYVFSDFQKNQFDFSEIENDTINNYFLFPTSYELSRNVFIDSVFLDNPVLNDAIENKLNIRLRNAGNEAVNDLSLVFTVNDAQVSANSLDMEPQGIKDLTIDISGLRDSVNNCIVSIEDFPITFDNRFHFTLQRTKKIKVLEVYGDENLKYIKRVFDSELFDFSSQSAKNLNYSLINEIDFLVLNQLPSSDPGLLSVVSNFIGGGGTVFFIPRSQIDDISLLQTLSNGLVSKEQVNVQKGTLAKPQVSNPFFSGVFEGRSAQIDQVVAKPAISWRHGENILSFNNGQPYLSKFMNGNGVLFALGSSLDQEESGFAESSLFLPVVYKMVFSSLNAQSINLYYRKNTGLIVYEATSTNSDQVFRLKSEGVEVIPPQRKLNGTVIFDINGLELNAGFWQVCDGNGRCEGVIPINESKNESIIVQHDLDELNEFAAADNVFVLNAGELEASVGQGIESLGNKYFWKYALLLALVFFFAEVLILRFL